MSRFAVSLVLLAAFAVSLPASAGAAIPNPQVQKITITGPAGELNKTGTRQYTATATYVGGGTGDVTTAVTWTSSKTTIATIDSTGLALGIFGGSTIIKATDGTVTSNGITLVVSKCNILGTNDGEELIGTPDADVICGLGGDDTIYGSDGADTIEGGAGVDTLYGESGADRILGGTEGDTISGGSEKDFLYGNDGDDAIGGGTGNDQLFGESGDDDLFGDEGGDRLTGGIGIDELYGEEDNDRLLPGKDADSADGGDGIDIVDYSDTPGPLLLDLTAADDQASGNGVGTDDITAVENAVGTSVDDTMTALATGSDLTGGAGPDSLYGGAGPDILRGGTGDDVVNAGGGNDVAYGDAGFDTLGGDAGIDKLIGGADDDTLNGSTGDDTLQGDAGDDTLNGEDDADRLYPGLGNDTNDGGNGVDTVLFDAAGAPMSADLSIAAASGQGNDTLTAVENLTGTNGDDGMNGDGGANAIDGLGGNDQLNGADGDDRLLGRTGEDTITGGLGFDGIDGGDHADSLEGGDDGDDLTGGGGGDYLDGQAGEDVINPGIGDDTIVGGANFDSIVYSASLLTGVTIDIDAGTSTGGGGNDAFSGIEGAGGTPHDDTLFGDENFNRFSGKGGSDTIDGRGGVDAVYGGSGDDFLHGGSADVDYVDGQGDTDTCGEGPDTRISCELSFNVAPTLTIVDNTNTFTEGEAAKAVDGTLTLTDDEANTDGATVTIASGFESGKDFLSVSGVLPGGVTANYVAPTLTISGTATVAQYETMLRNVRFENTSQDPSTTNRTISFTVSDGELSDSTGNDVTMGVLRVNDAPVADADSYGPGQRGVRMRVGTTHADSHETEHSGQVLDGDVDVDTPTANLSVTPGAITSTDCAVVCPGNVTMSSDGTFTYDPPAGDDGTDTFVYTVEDNDTFDSDGTEDTHTATVTITRTGDHLWFVDDSAPAGGRGVSHSPVQSLGHANLTGGADKDGANDRIFVYSGTYTAGIDLETGQKLIGEPHGLNASSTQFVAAGGTKPAISSTTGNVVTMPSGNEVQDLALGNTPAANYSLEATSGAGVIFRVADTDIVNGTGGALHITGGEPQVGLGTVTSTGSNNHGVRIANTSGGAVSTTGGTLSNASLADFATSNSNTAVTLGSAISDDVGQLINVNGGAGDVTYNGTITDGEDSDGDGIAILNTSGDHNFTKSVLVSVSPGQTAMSMSNSASGTLRMVPTAGTSRLASTTGTALNVTDTPIHVDGLKFEKISSQGASKYGINLQNTGTTDGVHGRLEIAGTGTASSGGIISGKTDGSDAADVASDTSPSAGIYIGNARGPSIAHMRLSGFGDFAIRGRTVRGFEMANSVIDSSVGVNGNNATTREGAIAFSELTGTGVAITNSTISQGFEGEVWVSNTTGNLNRLTISGNTFANSQSQHNANVELDASNSATLNATVQSNIFGGARGDQIGHTLNNSAQSDLVVKGNTMSGNHPNELNNSVNINVAAGGGSFLQYDIDGNTMRDANGTAMVVWKGSGGSPYNATLVGQIRNNTIGVAGTNASGSTNGSGIDLQTVVQGKHSVQILNNQVRQYKQNGIYIQAGGAAATPGFAHDGDLNVTLNNNIIANPATPAGAAGGGLQARWGTNTGDVYDVCFSASGNTIAGSAPLGAGSTDLVFWHRFDTKVSMPGWGGPYPSADSGAAVNAALDAYWSAKNSWNGAAISKFYSTNTASATGGYYNTPGASTTPGAGSPCPTT